MLASVSGYPCNLILSAQGRRFFMAKAYDNASLIAASPDGGKFCLYSSTFLGDRRSSKKASKSTSEGLETHLEILELGTWQERYRRAVVRMPITGVFSRDSNLLYIQTPLYKEQQFDRFVVDWGSRRVLSSTQERMSRVWRLYYAFHEDRLVGSEYDTVLRQHTGLIHATFTDWKVQNRVPLPLISAATSDVNQLTDFTFSTNGEYFAHVLSRALIYRRSSDLTSLWTHEHESSPNSALEVRRVALSADGSFVAIAMAGRNGNGGENRSHVLVLSGRDGTLVARIPIDATAGLAISPDGRLLAVGERIVLDKVTEQTQLSVQLIEVSSTNELASFMHDRVYIKRGEWANGAFGISGIKFTSDGKYLISSGLHTRVWNIR